MAEIFPHVDCLEAGSGPLVVLIHSSVASARQWRKLIEVLKAEYHVKAVQLFGYGETPQWSSPGRQSLADQAELVESLISDAAVSIDLVGHSFGGAVAMKTAARLGSRVRRLVLLEPNPFDLLRQGGRAEAYQEIQELRDTIKAYGAADNWLPAAERFAEYWGGVGTWAAMDDQRRFTFATALKPNFHEWDAIMDESTTLHEWSELAPRSTTVVYDPNTVRPIREIVELMKHGTPWDVRSIPQGGHMAPLTHPDVVNPIVIDALHHNELNT
jgi:pimeloyl-ACP methyl ester carboxylesterase